MKDSESEIRLLVNCHKNYLQLLYREIEGDLLFQGFPRPTLPTIHPECSEGCLVCKIGQWNPWLSIIFNFQKKSSFKQSSFVMEVCKFFHKNFAERVIILLNVPLLEESMYWSVMLVKRR